MTPRRIGLLAVAVSMSAAGWYFVVYLGRWEWNRAIVAGVIFIAAEVGLIGVQILDRLSELQRRLDGLEVDRRHHQTSSASPGVPADPRVVSRLHEAAPPARKPFSWLDDASQRMSVFVPVLLGAGILLSGMAWVVERIGRLTAGPTLEQRLARRLDSLALPSQGLLDDESADPLWPGPASRERMERMERMERAA